MIVLQLTLDELRALIREEVRAAVGPQSEAVLRTEQVAARLHMHPKTIARLVRQEGLPAHRLGSEDRGEYRFRLSEVDAWLAARQAKKTA